MGSYYEGYDDGAIDTEKITMTKLTVAQVTAAAADWGLKRDAVVVCSDGEYVQK